MTPSQLKDIQNLFPTLLAFWSFIVGTVLLLLHLIYPHEDHIVMYGMIYTLLAFFINGITFLVLFFQVFLFWDEKDEFIFQMLILLINIPITIAYFFIVITYK